MSSSAARTTNCWRTTAITRTCIKSNFSKKSLNANERFPRRREIRKALRLDANPPADEVPASVPLVCCCRSVPHAGRHGHGTRGPLSYAHCSGQLHRPWVPFFHYASRSRDGSAVGCGCIYWRTRRQFCAAVSSRVDSAVGWTGNDVSPPQGNLRKLQAPADEFF